MSTVKLLHGTDHIIERPDFLSGNPHNDYGKGFYCTEEDEMAREWACKNNTKGFVNIYDFNTHTLRVLNLSDGNHNILNWIALFLKYRTFDAVWKIYLKTQWNEAMSEILNHINFI